MRILILLPEPSRASDALSLRRASYTIRQAQLGGNDSFLACIDLSGLPSAWASFLLYLALEPLHLIRSDHPPPPSSASTLSHLLSLLPVFFIPPLAPLSLASVLVYASETHAFETLVPLIPSPPCATESWSATPHVGVSTINTTWTCAPPTAPAATTRKSEPCSSATPAAGTRRAGRATPHPSRAAGSFPTRATRVETRVAPPPVDRADETYCLRWRAHRGSLNRWRCLTFRNGCAICWAGGGAPIPRLSHSSRSCSGRTRRCLCPRARRRDVLGYLSILEEGHLAEPCLPSKTLRFPLFPFTLWDFMCALGR